jgi:hypothetical protein
MDCKAGRPRKDAVRHARMSTPNFPLPPKETERAALVDKDRR